MKEFVCAVFALPLVSPLTLAANISGTVTDTRGQPIATAEVRVVGSNIATQTDDQGQFRLENLTDDHVELHVEADGFGHKNLHLHEQALAQEGNVRIRLAPSALEVVDVVGLPWHASVLESALPVKVLSGDSLREKQGATLGETLDREVGVHTSHHGRAASSPVIRGLSGPRVMITQNGLDAGDASRVGPDHAVATEATTAQQIEILRGPATLFYGSGAIGGVINIVDQRVPQDNETRGEWLLQHNTVADENTAAASLTTGTGNVGVHVDGFWREAGDYRIPVPADIDAEHGSNGNKLANSGFDASGFNLGGSYLLDRGHLGISFGRLDRTYGIPGHSHGSDEHTVDDGHDAEPEEQAVYADLTQDRIQFHSELTLDQRFLSAFNTRFGYTDYIHHEIEAGQIFTTFENTSYEGRADAYHHPLGEWRGVATLHYKHQDFSAVGAEAFTPPSNTDTLAVALIEERHLGDFQFQLGARLEHVTIRADGVTLDLEEQNEQGENLLSVFDIEHTFEPISLSAGAVWDFNPGYNLGLSLSRAQRAPSSAELLSYGPHLGTDSFEVGAIYQLHDEGEGHYHIELSEAPVELESSNNVDLALRKFEGEFGFVLNAFYNRMDDMYYPQDTGFIAEDTHAHEHENENEHEHAQEHAQDEGLAIFKFESRDATLYGFESQFDWQINAPLKATVSGDYIRGKLRDGGNLPRIPPLRLGAELAWTQDRYGAQFGVTHYFEQDHTGARETVSPGYTLWNTRVEYRLTLAGQELTAYLQGDNLTDEEARPHTSFLKDQAPLPGRAWAAGVRASF